MKRKLLASACVCVVFGCCTGLLFAGDAREAYLKWKVHDKNRPIPQEVVPGFAGHEKITGQAPSDAIVLFDGTSTDAFRTPHRKPIEWQVVDGSLVVVPGKGDIFTNEVFGDVQMHVEYMIPGKGNDKTKMNNGNSGIYLMDRYEVQVINNEKKGMYADGMAGAVYGQFPPLVDVDKGMNQWQTYDIIFKRPRFDKKGKVITPAYLTILHNGVLVQNHQEIMGPTVWRHRTSYKKHSDKLPIKLQNHKDPVHYRNIWVRDLEPNAND